MNPVSMIVAGVLLAATFASGWAVNGWRIHAEAKRAEDRSEVQAQKLTEAAVAAIDKLRPVYTTINKGIERETRTEVRYRDCVHTDESWRLLDAAYQAAGGEPLGDRTGLPAAATPVRP